MTVPMTTWFIACWLRNPNALQHLGQTGRPIILFLGNGHGRAASIGQSISVSAFE